VRCVADGGLSLGRIGSQMKGRKWSWSGSFVERRVVAPVQIGIDPIVHEKFPVIALLDYLSVAQDDDTIGVAYGRQDAYVDVSGDNNI